MLTHIEDYRFASTLEEAVSILHDGRGHAAVIAGGTDLVPSKAPGIRTLVDITRLPLKNIEGNTSGLHLGACATLQALADHRVVTGYMDGFLKTAILASANRLLRNAATLGGNLVSTNPAWDLVTALLVTDATVTVMGPSKSERSLPIEEFLLRREEHLTPGHIVTTVDVPKCGRFTHSGFHKLNRCAHDAAIVTATARITAQDGKMKEVRLALGCVADRPLRLHAVEEALEGTSLQTNVEAACEKIRKLLHPPSDVRASAEYRTEMAIVLARRALQQALSKVKA